MIRKLCRAPDPELDAQLDLILQHHHDEQYPLKATTLSGYGITDAYTKEESDNKFGLLANAIETGLALIASSDPLGVPKPYFSDILPEFYLWCDGETIGDASSGATARANADVHDLFVVLWSATGLKIYESTGALSARGASAEADWVSHKRLELPNMTDNFLRGPQQGRDIGSTQGDAIRNITGTFVTSGEEYSGAFYRIKSVDGATLSGTDALLGFDASRVVPTADENRPKNISCNWILRY